ncbi:hypothetical protein EHQ94_02150 [Leptospira meyeri]|uniref:hypothetical protein n=1 Tax=Leptospira meyeri TaxID=29508 RepID=UPI0010832884|nr:hypothetical protein [Leptospira meyeri]TGM65862.1 hypothetical protein EHQ93_08930 [Leptospira meyeri]TGM72074.1 hypothetical protein EHQ94_02150 [Leptospira meyeri]
MASQEQISTLVNSYTNFKNLNIGTIEINHKWNNYSFNDIKLGYNEILNIMDSAINQNIWSRIYTIQNFYSTLTSYLNSCIQLFQQIINNQTNSSILDQNYNQIIGLIDAILQQLRTNNIPYLISGGFNIQNELTTLEQRKEEINYILSESGKINDQSKKIILTINSDKISNSFGSRKNAIRIQKFSWLSLIIFSILISSWLTFDKLIPFIEVENSKKNVKQQEDTKGNDKKESEYIAADFLVGVSLRVTGISPFLFLFFFSISQYNKEREYEEQYAHRESVSSSIPGYYELINNPAIRDELAKDATAVIFSIPVLSKTERLEEKSLKFLERIGRVINTQKPS